jgi:NAD(P)-dependent dehydrogenase (short-subunit alcohol dehydrogenase family)
MGFFTSKVAVITGAASGIGRALAIELARRGARLALSDIDMDGLAQTRSLCGPAEVRVYRLDTSSREDVYAHARDVGRDFGAVHLLFNNAGATVIGTIEHLTIEEIEWQLGINLWGVIYGTKAFLPSMLSQKQGWIVNVSSVFGFVSYPSQGAYNISKFGVRGLTECLWQELEGSGVEAVCVHPGGIRTSIEKTGRRSVNAGEAEAGFTAIAQKLLVTPPEVVAIDVLDGIERGKRRILTGKFSSTLHWLSRLLPNHYPQLVKLLG